MQIQKTSSGHLTAPKRQLNLAQDEVKSTPALAADSFVASSDDDCQRVFGSVGAMTGALLGRTATSLGGAVLGGMAVGALGLGIGTFGLGIAAIGLGAAVGLGLGVKGELASKGGRLIGGLAGGMLGSTIGWAADKLGFDTSEKMSTECKGFSVSKLPSRLLDTNYSSHPKLGGEVMKEGIAQAKPGDIIITNNDNNFKLEILQKLTGGKADWTHAFLVDDQNQVIDILQEDNTPRQMPIEAAFTENNHVKILRPDYKSEESVDKTIAWSKEQFGKITYDTKFDLKTKDAMYCQEYIYNALEHGAPEIEITPRKALGLKEVIMSDEFSASPDMTETWTTGSDFWLNWLSHFN